MKTHGEKKAKKMDTGKKTANTFIMYFQSLELLKNYMLFKSHCLWHFIMGAITTLMKGADIQLCMCEVIRV